MVDARGPERGDGYAWHPDDAFRRASNWQRFIDAEGLADYPALA